jgi:hypothetical protein
LATCGPVAGTSGPWILICVVVVRKQAIQRSVSETQVSLQVDPLVLVEPCVVVVGAVVAVVGSVV